MGMIDAFISGVANFSGMTDLWQDLFIYLAKHKTFIDMNEEGTSAAAVTITGGTYGSPPPEFIVNKPFFFAIRDELTGTILFMGQVYHPEYD
jgi:serpin B